MKKAYEYLTLCVLAVLSIACSKNEPAVNEYDGGEYKIGFGKPSTKGLEPDTNAPLQISIYDLYTSNGSEVVYIDDKLQKSTDADANAWALVSGSDYAWKSGSHKFFGWVSTDESGTPVPSLNYSEKVKVLSIGSASAPVAAVDYRYAKDTTIAWPNDDMIETVGGKKTAKPVSLTVKHLTAALTYALVNNTGDEVAITSVAVSNIANTGSATVDYSGDAVDVTYTPGETKGSVSLAADTFNCVWPQEVEGAKVAVEYTLNGDDVSAEIDIPDTEWEAGLYYTFTFEVINKALTLTFKVLPWELVDKTMDTSNGSINMSNVTWMNTKMVVAGKDTSNVDIPAYAVTMFYHPEVNGATYTANNGYYPAQGFFTVNYPEHGKFFIDLIPAYGEKTFDKTKYEIYIYDPSSEPTWRLINNEEGEEITRTTVYFQVRAAASQDGAQHKAQINIWFIPDGSKEKISAYSEIRANYALTIPKTS